MLIQKQFFFLIFISVFSLPEILTPPKSEGSPPMVKILKKCLKAIFDSSKEASWCTEYNAKTPALFKVQILKKIGITSKNTQFQPKTIKMVIFGGVSWFFQ